MSNRTESSYKASYEVARVLPASLKAVARDRALGGSGVALAGALMRALPASASARERPRVWELGGAGECFAHVLALHTQGYADSRAVSAVRALLADALACKRLRGVGTDEQVSARSVLCCCFVTHCVCTHAAGCVAPRALSDSSGGRVCRRARARLRFFRLCGRVPSVAVHRLVQALLHTPCGGSS